MKKTRFKLVALAAIVLSVATLISCSDDDPTAVAPVITGPSSWTRDKEALASAAAAYPHWQRLSSSFSFLVESATASTISFEGPDSDPGPLVSLFQTDVNNWYPTKIFNYLYVSISDANRTVAQADSSFANENLSQATIDLARGRALFIRGLAYLYLVELWGEVPLILTANNPSTAEQTTRQPIEKVYTQIIKDLTEAEALLPAYEQTHSNPSKGAANAILARAYLQWASKPLSQSEVAAIALAKNDPAAPSWDSEKLQNAVAYANKVINSGNYSLEPNFADLWGVKAENRSAEHIFTIHHDGDDLGDLQGNHQTHCPFTERFDLYVDNHIGPSDVTLVDRFSDSDTRKKWSIITSLYNIDEEIGSADPDVIENYKRYEFIFPVTSPRISKYIHRSPKFPEAAYSTEGEQPNNINRIEIRYAEVLLIKAEALLNLGRAGEALTPVNQLRQRAGLSNLSALTQDALENEWYLELFFEQKEWLNLTRWRKLVSSVLTEVPQYEYYKSDYASVATIIAAKGPENDGTNGTKTNYPFFAKIYKHLHSKTDRVSGKFYRFPIPKGLSGNDLGIEQNPGY
ncbi:MAG: RagB/SusD family nutrient uptake outer membrane protein [Prevotellaceae bacterium]|jgi:hypothetical protein|nr:RagB/SusD family nutrient uptake outer membrane protein [Prevotellaceae bacterium]